MGKRVATVAVTQSGLGWRADSPRSRLGLPAGSVAVEESLDLIKKNPRNRRDRLGPVAEKPPQPLAPSLGHGNHPLPEAV